MNLTIEGKINQVNSKLCEETCFVYGESWSRVREKIREENVSVNDIDEALSLILKSLKVKEGTKEYNDLHDKIEELYGKLGPWTMHCLAAESYVKREKIVTERAEQWFNKREAFFDGEEAAIGIALSKSKARKLYFDTKEFDDWG